MIGERTQPQTRSGLTPSGVKSRRNAHNPNKKRGKTCPPNTTPTAAKPDATATTQPATKAGHQIRPTAPRHAPIADPTLSNAGSNAKTHEHSTTQWKPSTES